MRFFARLFRRSRPSHLAQRRHKSLRCESLEARSLMAADVLPVLMVIADGQDFYYQEYNDTRASLEQAGLEVQVAATTTNTSTPHSYSGPGWELGATTPDVALADVNPDNYSAIVFVGGWGSSMYQYSFGGNYDNDAYDGDLATKQIVNNLINDFLADDKQVAAICHATTVLAWARVDGVSPLEGKQVSVPSIGSPAVEYNGQSYANQQLSQYEQAVANGAIPNTMSGQYGQTGTATDDVVVDGQIITAENWDSAREFGRIIAIEVTAAAAEDVPAPENLPPVASDALWTLEENAALGTIVGVVAAADANTDQALSYAIVGGNVGGAFAIDPASGAISVANSAALDFESIAQFELVVEVTDNGAPALADTALVTIELTNLPEAPLGPVHMQAGDLVVNGTDGADVVYLWSNASGQEVSVWMNGVSYGSHRVEHGGRTIVYGGDGNDQIFATDMASPVAIFAQAGHDLVTGGKAADVLDGGDGWDRLTGNGGDDLIRGGAGNDYLYGGEGNDIILGGAGNDFADGNAGHDLLFGGLGSDTVYGSGGDDLLIGGRTSFDQDDSALFAIRNAWTVPTSVANRANQLASGIGSAIQFAWDSTLHDDGENDTLWGGSDADLLFARPSDSVYAGMDDLVR